MCWDSCKIQALRKECSLLASLLILGTHVQEVTELVCLFVCDSVCYHFFSTDKASCLYTAVLILHVMALKN